MYKKIFLVTCAALALAGAPQYLEGFGAFNDSRANAEADSRPRNSAMTMTVPETERASYTTGVRKVSIPMDHSGHFVADFRVNGRTVNGVIDTGATYVALNETTARSLGVRILARDFIHEVRTANGNTQAAMVTLDRVAIGAIEVASVGALVLRDNALSGTLIGMSFMSKLKAYQVAGKTLELVE